MTCLKRRELGLATTSFFRPEASIPISSFEFRYSGIENSFAARRQKSRRAHQENGYSLSIPHLGSPFIKGQAMIQFIGLTR
jgi:hypothetical protein